MEAIGCGVWVGRPQFQCCLCHANLFTLLQNLCFKQIYPIIDQNKFNFETVVFKSDSVWFFKNIFAFYVIPFFNCILHALHSFTFRCRDVGFSRAREVLHPKLAAVSYQVRVISVRWTLTRLYQHWHFFSCEGATVLIWCTQLRLDELISQLVVTGKEGFCLVFSHQGASLASW